MQTGQARVRHPSIGKRLALLCVSACLQYPFSVLFPTASCLLAHAPSGPCKDICGQVGQAELRGPRPGLVGLAPRLVQPPQPSGQGTTIWNTVMPGLDPAIHAAPSRRPFQQMRSATAWIA